eukprot:13531114-Alexandrium_andersonii.AAC.1
MLLEALGDKDILLKFKAKHQQKEVIVVEDEPSGPIKARKLYAAALSHHEACAARVDMAAKKIGDMEKELEALR